MKLQDIETSIKEALERLSGINSDIVQKTSIRDSLNDQVSQLRSAKNQVEVQKNELDNKVQSNKVVIEQTSSQIEDRKTFYLESINKYNKKLSELKDEESAKLYEVKTLSDGIELLKNSKKELEGVLLSIKTAKKELEGTNATISKLKEEVSEMELQKIEFLEWKSKEEEYIEKQKQGLIEKENYLSVRERRLEKLKANLK